MENLKQIYEVYLQKMGKAKEGATILTGAFGMGDDPRRDACNQIFYEHVEEWVRNFSISSPSSEQAATAVRFILEAAHRTADRDASWYMFAAQKHVVELIPALTPDAARELRKLFSTWYPKLDWAPVQEEVYRLLSQRAGESDANERKMSGLKKIYSLFCGGKNN